MSKYKFAVDPNLVTDIKAFLQKNPTLFPTPPEIKQNVNISAHVKFATNDEDSLFKFHKFLLKIHHIESPFSKKDINDSIPVTLNGTTGYKAYFNYVLSSLFCQYLKESSVKFSISKIKERYFHLWECIPISITKDDLNRVKRTMAKTPLKNYQIINPLIHIIADD